MGSFVVETIYIQNYAGLFYSPLMKKPKVAGERIAKNFLTNYEFDWYTTQLWTIRFQVIVNVNVNL